MYVVHGDDYQRLLKASLHEEGTAGLLTFLLTTRRTFLSSVNPARLRESSAEREFFIDSLLVRIDLTIEMI